MNLVALFANGSGNKADAVDDIVKLNLKNKDVQAYLLEAVSFWIKKFDIDGLRLDVAGYLNRGFIRRLHNICLNLKSDFWLLGCKHESFYLCS